MYIQSGQHRGFNSTTACAILGMETPPNLSYASGLFEINLYKPGTSTILAQGYGKNKYAYFLFYSLLFVSYVSFSARIASHPVDTRIVALMSQIKTLYMVGESLPRSSNSQYRLNLITGIIGQHKIVHKFHKCKIYMKHIF